MPLINEKTCFALALVWSLVHSPSLFASEDTSASIVKFQQTMAARGQATAQYKLGMFYETGTGVVQNLDTARIWYQQAASQSYTPAAHRLRYLDLRQGKLSADQAWLKQLHQDAQAGDGETMLLLGQMYAQGTGVTQELTLATRYLRRARAENIPGSDAELAQVEASINQKQAEAMAAEKRQAELTAQREQQKTDARRVKQQREQQILAQKKLADAQQLRQQQMHKKQSEVIQDNSPVPPHKAQTLANQKALPLVVPGVVTEIDMSPCSGRYRFASTCR